MGRNIRILVFIALGAIMGIGLWPMVSPDVSVQAKTTRMGAISGKFVKIFDAVTLNGTNVATGTSFKIKDNIGFMSLFYQVTAGTSTAHYQIRVYASPDDASYTTTGVLATASADETSTDFKHVMVSLGLTNYARIDVEGVASNATDTAINVWRGTQ